MPKYELGQPLSPVLVPGVILWRPVVVFDKTCLQACVEAQDTGKGTYMLRMRLNGAFLKEPEISDPQTRGLVVFTKEPLPERWTHVVVRDVSKALKEPRPYANSGGRRIFDFTGGAVFADVAPPIEMGAYLAFRNEAFSAFYTEGGDISLDDYISSVGCPTVKGGIRLMVDTNSGKYTHFRMTDGTYSEWEEIEEVPDAI